MRTTHRNLAYAVSGAVLSVGVLPFLPASAGHTNTVLQASLSGRAEVGASSAIAGDPNGRGQLRVFGVDGDPTTLCYVMTVSKIAAATAAHLHQGAAGQNGPVVVNLARPADGDAADCLTEGEILPSGAAAFPTGLRVAEILANPSAFYGNVHNEEFPGGAIRGQLSGH